MVVRKHQLQKFVKRWGTQVLRLGFSAWSAAVSRMKWQKQAIAAQQERCRLARLQQAFTKYIPSPRCQPNLESPVCLCYLIIHDVFEFSLSDSALIHISGTTSDGLLDSSCNGNAHHTSGDCLHHTCHVNCTFLATKSTSELCSAGQLLIFWLQLHFGSASEHLCSCHAIPCNIVRFLSKAVRRARGCVSLGAHPASAYSVAGQEKCSLVYKFAEVVHQKAAMDEAASQDSAIE